MDTPISRAEHEEFRRNMESEHKRIHYRLDSVEESTKQITTLAVSIEKLAISVQNLVDAQEIHESRLKILENKDGDMWRSTVKYIITSVISLLIGYIFSQLTQPKL